MILLLQSDKEGGGCAEKQLAKLCLPICVSQCAQSVVHRVGNLQKNALGFFCPKSLLPIL